MRSLPSFWAATVLVGALMGCSAGTKTVLVEPSPTSDVDPTKAACGLRAATLADGSCMPVGPADPAPESAAAFVRSVDGWGIDAKRADANNCGASEMAVLGESACVPVDDCSRAFPPPEAEVVVSTKMTGANV